MEYSHFDKSAVCASLGYYVGKKGSEVQTADGSGLLYQAGSTLTISNSSRNPGSAPSIASGAYRIAAGSAACSLSCTVDTGLTSVYHMVASIQGKMANGKIATLDNPATPDASLFRLSHATCLRYAYAGGNAEFKIYGPSAQSRVATLDPLAKMHRIEWIAFGT